MNSLTDGTAVAVATLPVALPGPLPAPTRVPDELPASAPWRSPWRSSRRKKDRQAGMPAYTGLQEQVDLVDELLRRSPQLRWGNACFVVAKHKRAAFALHAAYANLLMARAYVPATPKGLFD
jgi:hypothetical protein